MFAQCAQLWHLDDFSRCFQHQYLQTAFPLFLCAVSALLLVAHIIWTTFESWSYHGYKPLQNKPNSSCGRGGPAAVEAEDEAEESDNESEVTDVTDLTEIDDELGRNTDLALNPTVSQANRISNVTAEKPKGEKTLVAAEVVGASAMVVINIVALGNGAWGPKGGVAAIAGVVTWAYILLISSTRFASSLSTQVPLPQLWYHTAFLYGFIWILSALLFRSYIIHPLSNLSRVLMILAFALNSILFGIALSSRAGNKSVQVEYEGDIPPAREPTASVFSRASFSWVDGVVWQGYKKTFELADVWNVSPQEKASVVLANYRQLKKTTKLAWHLLKFFRADLLSQAAWAALGGALTFAPTLLLREILRYVEEPEDTPRNSAWFFVILLFFSGCGSALADGQALWIGRHTCIRVRAVIVGEIYAKALKRKVGTSADKVLGEKKDKSFGATTGLFNRIMSLGRRKKKEEKGSGGSDSQVTSGTVINLMAVDSFKVSELTAYLHFLWAATPVQIIMAIVLLYQTLGFSSIAGIGMMIFLLPVNLFIANRFSAVQKKILAATDARINTTNEVLSNIRIIKYFAWESRFIDLINETRTTEMKRLRTRYILWASAATVWGGAPIMITFLSFAVYTFVEKKDLVPSVAFTALSLFQILRIPLDQLADMVAHVQEAKVSVDRVEEFLSEEDTQKYKQLRHSSREDVEPTIGFDKGTFSWGSNTRSEIDVDAAFHLMDLDMRFRPGQLNVVAGPTGSGKTSLLMALLGEMTLLSGRVHLPGGRSREEVPRDPQTGLTESVAYCAQQAWLVNGTVKQNIVFASPWDEKRYREVIRVCALRKDLEILDSGDETLVGEKGVSLSGGQKQRIALARALYCSARHVLLDDILSAVDSHTAKWIFDYALMGPLMYHRTCVLVTHNISLCLPHAQFAVLLENGRVVAQGTASDVISSGKLDHDVSLSNESSTAPSRVPSMYGGENGLMSAHGIKTQTKDANGNLIENQATDKFDIPSAGPAKATQSSTAAAMQESKEVGHVKYATIMMYLKAMGPWWFWTVAAVVFVAQQLSSLSTNIWIREWANAYTTQGYHISASKPQSSGTYIKDLSNWNPCFSSGSCTLKMPFFGDQSFRAASFAEHAVDAGYYLGIYAILGAAFFVITFIREGVLFAGSLAASRRIHQNLIYSVSHAKFRFFDTTPLGQIMNRFSKDIEQVDQEIAPVAVGVIHCLATIIMIVIVISTVTPGFLIAGFFITIMYVLIGKFYINSSRDLKRLESVQRSPLYQQFGETLSGMTTIRAYGDERRFIRDNLTAVNTHNRPFIYLWGANRWLAFRVDIAGALVSFFSGVFVVLSVGTIDAGAAGLALTYAITFTENVLWFVRLYAMNEQNMNSVERIKEYLDVEQEAPPIIPERRPAPDWPSRGAVEFVGYSTRYRKDFELVLVDVSFKILPGEKVGVVGRTGAGKSSLALALFRALEAESGKIFVDEVDIGLIGLQDLRQNIVMVPQDPTLFTGTIRSNLDPFGVFTDTEIFTALRRVQLIGSSPSSNSPPSRPSSLANGGDTGTTNTSSTANVPTIVIDGADSPTAENKNIFLDLSSTVAESGSNLSQGQRQLLCLARALLKSPKVLLMDEATASIDYTTDSKVQEAIRELKDNTIITIAHRLKTIVDYDKVIVMEKGEVVEMGVPWELLRPKKQETTDAGEGADPPKRWFREMCEMSGELEVLEREAKKSWESKRLVDDS